MNWRTVAPRSNAKAPASDDQEKKIRVTAVVHTVSGGRQSVDLGEVTTEQLQTVNITCSQSFHIVTQSIGLTITDSAGTTYHFNRDNIEFVEVRVQ
jgi:type 1 fimbria pilin